MERTVTKLRGDLVTCNEELSQRTLQLSQLRKRECAVLFVAAASRNGNVLLYPPTRSSVFSVGSHVRGVRQTEKEIRTGDGHVGEGNGTSVAGKSPTGELDETDARAPDLTTHPRVAAHGHLCRVRVEFKFHRKPNVVRLCFRVFPTVTDSLPLTLTGLGEWIFLKLNALGYVCSYRR